MLLERMVLHNAMEFTRNARLVSKEIDTTEDFRACSSSLMWS